MAAQKYVKHLKLSDKDDWESNLADVRSGGGAAADSGLEAHGGEEGVAREHSVDSLGKYVSERVTMSLRTIIRNLFSPGQEAPYMENSNSQETKLLVGEKGEIMI